MSERRCACGEFGIRDDAVDVVRWSRCRSRRFLPSGCRPRGIKSIPRTQAAVGFDLALRRLRFGGVDRGHDRGPLVLLELGQR